MAKGNPIVLFRLTPDLLAEMDAAISMRNGHTALEPYDRSAFIRAAIREKLEHLKRSRKRRGKRCDQTNGKDGNVLSTLPGQSSDYINVLGAEIQAVMGPATPKDVTGDCMQ